MIMLDWISQCHNISALWISPKSPQQKLAVENLVVHGSAAANYCCRILTFPRQFIKAFFVCTVRARGNPSVVQYFLPCFYLVPMMLLHGNTQAHTWCNKLAAGGGGVDISWVIKKKWHNVCGYVVITCTPIVTAVLLHISFHHLLRADFS